MKSAPSIILAAPTGALKKLYAENKNWIQQFLPKAALVNTAHNVFSSSKQKSLRKTTYINQKMKPK